MTNTPNNTAGEELEEKEIVNPTKQQIEEYLNLIGWSLRHHGCEHYYFYNHKKKNTGLKFFSDRIELEGEDWKTPSYHFYLKECVMSIIDETTVCFRGKDNGGIFILCPNYDMTREKDKTPSPNTSKSSQCNDCFDGDHGKCSKGQCGCRYNS